MKQLVIFLEERSARVMLENLLPRIIPPHITFKCIAFEGKQDLEKQLPIKLRGWLAPNTQFLVMRDRDKEDCIKVKRRLRQICIDSGKPETIVRIACSELESWYLGDLTAVEEALEISGIAKQQKKQKFRTPDKLTNAAQELQKLTLGKYQKISGSRAIGKTLRIQHNHSHSFQVFIKSILQLIPHTNGQQTA